MSMYPTPRAGGENNARELLLRMGMGDYNATIAIQYMFIAPAATDPAMPSIILMTKHLQQGLRAAGASISITGTIDDATAEALEQLVGPQWNQLTWFALLGAVVSAKKRAAMQMAADQQAAQAAVASSTAALGDIPGLPALPGGTFTYLALAGAAYYFLVYKKRSRR